MFHAALEDDNYFSGKYYLDCYALILYYVIASKYDYESFSLRPVAAFPWNTPDQTLPEVSVNSPFPSILAKYRHIMIIIWNVPASFHDLTCYAQIDQCS